MPHSLRPNLVIEYIDDDVLVLDGQSSTVHRFSGSHAEAIKHLDAGENLEAFSTELADFDAAGLLETESEGAGVSRRGVLLGGSALAGSAALAMSMPAVASAQSTSGNIEVEEFIFGGVSAPPRLTNSDEDWVLRLEQLPGDRFEEGQVWTLRILGFSAEVSGVRGPIEPLETTLVETATVGEDSSSSEPELFLEFVFAGATEADGGELPDDTGGNYNFQVRLEKGNLRSQPFLVES